jgi:DNA end-binding protein Ku
MLWPDEVRAADFASLDADVELRPQELKMAESLIESMAADFDPTQFSDEYQAAVRELINAKLERGESATLEAEESQPEAGKRGEVIDLLTALQRSVDRARGESTPSDKVSTEKVPAQKATAKAPAKKAAAKKAPVKKAAAKKAAAKKTAAAKTA